MRSLSITVMIVIIISQTQIFVNVNGSESDQLAFNETGPISSSPISAGSQVASTTTTTNASSSSPGSANSNSAASSSANAGAETEPATAASESSASFVGMRDTYDAKQEHQLAQQASMAGVELYPNHRNYPIEPYPSASYTSLSVTVAPQGMSHIHQQQLNSLLNRDHHESTQMSMSVKSPNDFGHNENSNASVGVFSNSFGNQSPNEPSSSYQNFQNSQKQQKHQADDVGASSPLLHTGLLQNLTASLFPVRSPSNSTATLTSLSDLLNRAKQPPTSFIGQATGGSQHKQHSVGPNEGNSYSTYFQGNSNLALTAGFPDSHYSSIFDQLKSGTSGQFGFRDSRSNVRYQQPNNPSAYFGGSPNLKLINNNQINSDQKAASASAHLQSSNQYLNDLSNLNPGGYKTASTMYTSYLPLKESLNPLTALTNGQALNMAALYDNYLVDNAYKFPLVVNNIKGYQSQHDDQQKQTSASNSLSQSVNSGQMNPNYHYIQHHNSNNQNHLDKVIYHSTPFRPSIVSPPQSVSESAGKLAQSSLPNQGSTLNNYKRQNSYVTNGQAINSSKLSLLKENGGSKYNSDGTGGDSGDSHISTTTAPSVGTEEFDYGRQQNQHYTRVQQYNQVNGNGSASSSTKQSSLLTGTLQPSLANINVDSDYKSQHSNRSNPIVMSPSSSPQFPTGANLFFDLYEREIDKQIQEALYGEHHLSEPLLGVAPQPAASVPMQSTNWFDKLAPSSSNIYEEAVTHSLPESWSRPIGLSSQSNYLSSMGPPRGTRYMSSESLASALQELPTFASTDLQPLYPSAPLYPLISSPHSHDSFNSAASMVSALAPHLLTGFTGQTGSDTINKAPNSDSNKSTETTFTTSTTTASPPTTSQSQMSANSGVWPSILLKLQSSPLSSILATPFSHFHSSLPKNRNRKKPNQNQSNNQQTLSASQTVNHYSHPTGASMVPLHPSINGKHLLSLLAGYDSLASATSSKSTLSSPTQPNASIQKGRTHLADLTGQQQRAVQLAEVAANLLAAASSGNQHWSPMQAALVQAGSTNPYLMNSDEQDLSTLIASLNSAYSSLSPNVLGSSEGGLSSGSAGASNVVPGGALGLTGAGISPFLWRSIFSPATWARKQSVSGAISSGNLNNLNNSSSNFSGQNSQQASRNPQASSSSSFSSIFSSQLPQNQQGSHKSNENSQLLQGGVMSKLTLPLSSLFGGATSHLFGPSANGLGGSTQSAPFFPSLGGQSGQAIKRPLKLRIKILRIPVAVYDQSGGAQTQSTSGNHATQDPLSSLQSNGDLAQSDSTAGSLKSTLTASLLASMPCPLTHSPDAQVVPHTLEQHLTGQILPTSSPLDGNQAMSVAGSTSAPSMRSSSSIQDLNLALSSQLTPSPFDRGLNSLQGFTDTNQPNDLQVSPSSPQHKIIAPTKLSE